MKNQSDITAAREERFVQYIKEKRVLTEIAVREGLELDYVIKLRIKIAKERGLKLPKKGDTKALDYIGYGMDDQSKKMRVELSNKLWELTVGGGPNGKFKRAELAHLIGIPVKAQKKIMEKPYPWSWTLGQIQRLAKLHDTPFLIFMQEILK